MYLFKTRTYGQKSTGDNFVTATKRQKEDGAVIL